MMFRQLMVRSGAAQGAQRAIQQRFGNAAMRQFAAAPRVHSEPAQAVVPALCIFSGLLMVPAYQLYAHNFQEEEAGEEENVRGSNIRKRMRALKKEDQPLTEVKGGLKRMDSFKSRDSSKDKKLGDAEHSWNQEGEGKHMVALSDELAVETSSLGLSRPSRTGHSQTEVPEALMLGDHSHVKSSKFMRTKSVTAVKGISDKYM